MSNLKKCGSDNDKHVTIKNLNLTFNKIKGNVSLINMLDSRNLGLMNNQIQDHKNLTNMSHTQKT